MSSVFLSGNAEADALLADDPFALLMGMLLDHYVANPQYPSPALHRSGEHRLYIQKRPAQEDHCATGHSGLFR
ncbi:hypothetical protein [Brevibacterium aurantiacum]|uniref:hypothetical protein n=1 Tax=Brevibacterium aurantiacum TaxID=273384 RepID=UPI001D0354EE|nr:hypothetical protein [Brevibacterium aurantiacum]MDN6378179.1 hypothetical protein [Brevibacterium aurantiacum]